MSRHWYSDFPQDIYSKWHRKYDGIAYIDVDSVPCCIKCYEPLAVIETAKDVGQKHKSFTMCQKIANRLNLPGFVVLYNTDNKNEIINFRIKRFSPWVSTHWNITKIDNWVNYLRKLQELCCNEKIKGQNRNSSI